MYLRLVRRAGGVHVPDIVRRACRVEVAARTASMTYLAFGTHRAREMCSRPPTSPDDSHIVLANCGRFWPGCRAHLCRAVAFSRGADENRRRRMPLISVEHATSSLDSLPRPLPIPNASLRARAHPRPSTLSLSGKTFTAARHPQSLEWTFASSWSPRTPRPSPLVAPAGTSRPRAR